MVILSCKARIIFHDAISFRVFDSPTGITRSIGVGDERLNNGTHSAPVYSPPNSRGGSELDTDGFTEIYI